MMELYYIEEKLQKELNVSTTIHMWCNQTKLVWTWFFVYCMPQFQSYITLKTPSKLSIRFQGYSHFSDAQNNKIQRKVNGIIGSKNQYKRVQTHFAWSHHIWLFWCLVFWIKTTTQHCFKQMNWIKTVWHKIPCRQCPL